eukprot:CAMPEP_0114402850 /NCGR_PEP_ID=MMETSP0102-20121206/18345_1 /TAXON_ID=38822 ORGANISM="Pteridomonas danica, Strain PT" /NCGR_SAMPLE_ID=MMETSP0102 /ASSEMBLY_ACC=CAM_ASM_000212 /LENGTH=531 /DNA_ID=CAMNT_0001566711 /DNA_START=72 /DNA_END=1669 /DNA_ORIENTATION=+
MKRSYNPISNFIEIFYKPTVGVSIDKKGGNERLLGIDGIRALVYLWVLAYEINRLLGLLDEDYKEESKWAQSKLNEQFFWKIATQGYEGLSIFLVLSAFLFTYANLNMCYAEHDEFDDEATVLSKYLFMFCRRVVRIWPSLAAAVLFVGFIWPYWVNVYSETLDDYFLDKCEKTWWTNMYFVSNFWHNDCFLDLWAVSLNFQLAFLVPIPAYLFALGDTKRSYAYEFVYAVIILSLVARVLSVMLLDIETSPVTSKYSENNFYLQKMPWSRAGEYACGMLCCFSVFDDQEGEPPRLLNLYYIGTEKLKTWLGSLELLISTFLQTGTIGVGCFFLYVGTLQHYKVTFTLTDTSAAVILLFGDLLVASASALLLRWALHVEYGSWLRWFLSVPVWHPLASLSYSAFLFQFAAAYWAVEALKYHGHELKTGYMYFSKVYFTTLAITLGLAFLVHMIVEKPLIKLAASHCTPATPNPHQKMSDANGDAELAASSQVSGYSTKTTTTTTTTTTSSSSSSSRKTKSPRAKKADPPPA